MGQFTISSDLGTGPLDENRVRLAASCYPPPPAIVGGVSMHDLVVQDILNRKEYGRNKYGTELHAFDGRDPLLDAYLELLDLAIYMRKRLLESGVLPEESSNGLNKELTTQLGLQRRGGCDDPAIRRISDGIYMEG